MACFEDHGPYFWCEACRNGRIIAIEDLARGSWRDWVSMFARRGRERSMDLERLQEAIKLAQETIASGDLVDVPKGFGSRADKDYKAGRFTLDGEWVVCTAPMNSNSFQLLDATVRQRLERGAKHAVALLAGRPEGHGPEPTDEYLRRYQQVAWSALGVAWVLDAGSLAGKFLADPAAPRPERRDFEDLVSAIDEELQRRRPIRRPKNSPDAETVVLPAVDAALRSSGFEAEASRQYRGFWRSPLADGLWRRPTGSPGSFALEVKFDEQDVTNNPLCQAVEPLGHVDAMVYVRLTRPDAKTVIPPLAEEAKRLLTDGALVKYLSVPTE
jgi:hypothetical protein